MIISFSLENWMSFRDKVTFSMVASREKQHQERVSMLPKYKTKILPVAGLYGGNASGKSNFIKALSFVKKLVVRGTNPDGLIGVDLFRLDDKSLNQPAWFQMELLIDDKIFEYSFTVTQKSVIEERLVEIKQASEKILFQRAEGKVEFHKSLSNRQDLEFVFKGTRDNQLYITNSVSQKIDSFKHVYDWFKDNLKIITPETLFGLYQFPVKHDPFFTSINEALSLLDTGIVRLASESIPTDNLPIPESVKNTLREFLKEGETFPWDNKFVIIMKNGELIGEKITTYHSKVDGQEAEFELECESDGTQRIIELLPAFLELESPTSTAIYIIDEIDRSLHTLLTRNLLESYLSRRTLKTRSQLIFTTHDVLLMDQHLMRRDEMWVTDREKSGNTNLYSFSDYKEMRMDKDIRKSYLQGRLGGIPNLLLRDSLRG